MNTIYIKKDIKHFLVNLGTTMVVVLFYIKFGFYGWSHLVSLIFIHYAVLPLDDWMEKERSFPYYVLPMLAFAAYHFPLITLLALVGDVIVNLQAITGKSNFIMERVEGLGNIPIYVVPLTLPVGLNNTELYLAAILFILFADSFHKIGHKETLKPKLMWISGLIFLGLVSIIFATPTFIFFGLMAVTLISLIPFIALKKKAHSWAYSQVWFGIAAFIAFYYYLNVVIA